jgi:hypothetical protein
MAAEAIQQFSGQKLIPLHNPDLARTVAIDLVPGIYPSGTVLGMITSASVADVDTITVDACTHSTMDITALPDGSSYQAPQDITPAALQVALNLQLGAGSVAVTGTYAAGSGGTYILTWGGQYLDIPLPAIAVTATFVGGTVPTIANVHTHTGVGLSLYAPYVAGHSDGSQTPQAVLAWGVTVNDDGTLNGPGQWGSVQRSAVAYNRGQFACADLVGLDATALTNQPRWSLLQGTVATGELELA